MSSERRGQFKISPLRRYDRNGWKQSVRERCLEQVRARRRLLIAKARAASACQGDVHEELRSMIRESVASVRHQHHLAPAEAADDVAWPMDSDDLGTAGGVMAAVDEELHYDEFVDLMQQMEELLQQEVDAEAERMMTEYERAEHADAEAVSELAKEVEDVLQGSGVLCPVCQRCCLAEHKGVVFCGCGLRIDTKHDCLSLQHIQQLIAQCIERHRAVCAQPPQFQRMERFGIQSLVMQCGACGSFECVV